MTCLCAANGEVNAALAASNFAYLSLDSVCPPLGEIIQLRNVLGLRSPVHTLSRLLNPVDAPYVMQAIFHPAYRESHQHAAERLGYRNSCVIKGEGGEIEINPDAVSHLYGTCGGVDWDEEWPALSALRHVKPEQLDPEHLLAVWLGKTEDAYGHLAVIATMALALRGLGESREAAFAHAEQLWQQRLG